VSPDSLADRLPPLKPGDTSRWRWFQVVGAVLLGLSVVGVWAVNEWNPEQEPGSLAWMRFEGLIRSATCGLIAVGLPLVLWAKWIRDRPALLATLASAAVVLPMLALHDVMWSGRSWEGDARLFFRMADDWPWRPGGWFRFRVLAPWLARSLANNASDGYWRLAWFSVAATGPALSLLLRDLKFGDVARHLGVLLYLCSFATLYNSYNYAMPDPLAMLILVLACRAIVRGRDWELAIWLLLGALTKEVVLYLVPVRWLWGRESGLGVTSALRAVLVAAPAVLVFGYLRFRPEEIGEYTEFVRDKSWLFPWKHQPDNVARLYSPFAAGWALVALSLRGPNRWTRAALGFAVPCLLSLLVTDAGRMLVYLTPFAIPAILRAAGADDRISRRGLVAILLVCLSMRLWEPFLPLWRVPIMVRRPLALVLALACGWLVYRIAPSKTETTPAAGEAFT